jgi:hypothetical protein
MCLNCGCGEYDERHKPSDITREDLAKAADGQGMQLKETIANMKDSIEALAKADQKSA